MTILRKPAVAGYFYMEDTNRLNAQIERYVEKDIDRIKALGIVSPHAGIIYSGAVAGALYSRIILPDTIILIGPNHTGLGASVSVFPEGEWEMPHGSLGVDSSLATTIINNSKYATEDYNAHAGEHSLEVQLPFMQFFKKDFKIVPIVMMSTGIEVCRDLAHALVLAIREKERDVLIVASSDMTHYEPARSAEEKDKKAIEEILSLNPSGLHTVVREYGITMCGYAPAVTMLYATLELGAHRATLVKYMNSGDVSGDYERVVGYAGIIVEGSDKS